MKIKLIKLLWGCYVTLMLVIVRVQAQCDYATQGGPCHEARMWAVTNTCLAGVWTYCDGYSNVVVVTTLDFNSDSAGNRIISCNLVEGGMKTGCAFLATVECGWTETRYTCGVQGIGLCTTVYTKATAHTAPASNFQSATYATGECGGG